MPGMIFKSFRGVLNRPVLSAGPYPGRMRPVLNPA